MATRATEGSECQHPLSDLKIWRVWTQHFNQETVQHGEVQIVFECKCGARESLKSQIGEPSPIG